MGMAGKAEPNNGRRSALRKIEDPKLKKGADLGQKKGNQVRKDQLKVKTKAEGKEVKERAKAKEAKAAKEAKEQELKEQKLKEQKAKAKAAKAKAAKEAKEQELKEQKAAEEEAKAKEAKAKEAKEQELKEQKLKEQKAKAKAAKAKADKEIKKVKENQKENKDEDGKKAPITPPPRRMPFKSPESSTPESVAEAACAQLDAKRQQAESAMKNDLRKALEKAEMTAEIDAHNLEEFLEICVAENPSSSSIEKKLRGTIPVNPFKDDQLRRDVLREKEKQHEQNAIVAQETKEDDQDQEAEDSEHEEETEEEVSEEEESEVEECPHQVVAAGGDGDDMDESEGSVEDEDENENEDENEDENEEKNDDDDEDMEEDVPEPESKRTKKERHNRNALEKITQQTVEKAGDQKKKVRNSTTHKKEWDAFMRQVSNKHVFPASLAGTFLKNKTDLFGLWLDSDKDWDEVQVMVERKQQTINMERNQLQAVKARELKKSMDETKYKALIEKRMSQGLWYKDTDFPEDEEDFKGVSYAVLLVVSLNLCCFASHLPESLRSKQITS